MSFNNNYRVTAIAYKGSKYIIKGKIWINAIKDIKQGEELTYDYGYDMGSFEDHPCRCGSKNCVGFIVRSNLRWRVLKKIQNKKKK